MNVKTIVTLFALNLDPYFYPLNHLSVCNLLKTQENESMFSYGSQELLS